MQWNSFSRNVFLSFAENCESLIVSLRKRMPTWTPRKADNILYATIEEVYSGSFNDVGKYLVKLKNDLNIGEDGFPRYVVVGGDQQMYAHMSNLKLKYPGRFDWVYPVPGDWHM